MLKNTASHPALLSSLLLSLLLSACTSLPEQPGAKSESAQPTARATVDVQRMSELERQLAERTERQRQCLEEKRRLEHSLKENQKRSDELQKKLDAVLAIDRDLRRRSKGL